ncbi:phage tail sheath family protein [Enterobacteriaceae bacterium LUAb1]
MTVITTYPGVYLSEVMPQNFSVTHSVTAVPAFAYRKYTGQGAPEQSVSRYNNFAEFSAAIAPDHKESDFFNCVKFWFINGGGYCYLVHKDSVLKEIPRYEDITLLVAAGTEEDTFEQFTTLVQNGHPLFGLFDGPNAKISSTDTADEVMKNYPLTPRAAAFYPWGDVDWASKHIPPSAIAAVAINKTDCTHGVWKTPANVIIHGITPAYPVSDDLQGRFNQGKALNMIRHFPDVGTVLWGGRTLEDSDNWRYISVRRLFSMVEKDIQKALHKQVFEPNSQPTWQRVKAAVENYLYRLWQQGALLGRQAEEAYFVSIGQDITMTVDDIQQGKMIINIGLAAVRPAEFILLQFSQDIAQ